MCVSYYTILDVSYRCVSFSYSAQIIPLIGVEGITVIYLTTRVIYLLFFEILDIICFR